MKTDGTQINKMVRPIEGEQKSQGNGCTNENVQKAQAVVAQIQSQQQSQESKRS